MLPSALKDMIPPSFRAVPREHPVIRLLDNHASKHGYLISHLDTTPVARKVGAFLPSLVVNTILLIAIIWRARSGASHYIFLSVLTRGLIPRVNFPQQAWPWTVLQVTFDYFLFVIGIPVLWRYRGRFWTRVWWGFQETEVVFRTPTGPLRQKLDLMDAQERETKEWNALYLAVDKNFLLGKSGIATRTDLWILDELAPLQAYSMIAQGIVKLHDLELSVWRRDREGSWSVWEVHRLWDPVHVAAVIEKIKKKAQQLERTRQFDQWTKGLVDYQGRIDAAGFEKDRQLLKSLATQQFDIPALWAEAQAEVNQKGEGNASASLPVS